MIYVISFVVYAIVFMAGFYVVKKQPKRADKTVARLCLVGFTLQLMINYVFWGNIIAFSPISAYVSVERSAVHLMFLALIAIFFYAALLVVLFKAHDFYHE